jgi:hypothetical protein
VLARCFLVLLLKPLRIEVLDFIHFKRRRQIALRRAEVPLRYSCGF